MKVALVHDWLTGMRGGEKVLEALCEIFPEAHLFTLFHIPGSVSSEIEERPIKTTFVQKLPFVKKHYRLYLPLFPMAAESLDLSGYDLIISTSHCAAKGIITPPGAFHVSYIFTPMRYIWDKFDDYFGDRFWLKKRALGLVCHYLRAWDSASSRRVDAFIAISDYIAERVKKYYGRDSTVVNPPVDCARFSMTRAEPEDFYLCLSAFAPYKRIDLAVEALTATGARLKVVGTGQDEKRIRSLAGANVEFLGHASDDVVADLYSRCRALIFPGEEDFGIVPLEAMASGRPVIAYGKGGVLETIVPLFKSQGVLERKRRPTGVFFYDQSVRGLVEAVRTFEDHEKKFSPMALREHALKFDTPLFKKKFKETVLSMYNDYHSGKGICSKNTANYLKTSSL
ncbi:MAG: glycosyltransferase [Thermodesulfobacteriota bacterium]|nr:MAG: glycosyltransferase [Thermodesulfobacteriota bacterium]